MANVPNANEPVPIVSVRASLQPILYVLTNTMHSESCGFGQQDFGTLIPHWVADS